MNRFKRFLLLCLFFVAFSAFAQQHAFAPGEKLVFTASYRMSGLLTNLAQVTMETSEVKTSKATLWHFKCTAATFSKWDSYFKIRDLYETYVNPTNLKPILHKRDISEGGYAKSLKYNFSYKDNNAKITLNKRKIKDQVSNVKITPETLDVVTLVYQLRDQDLKSLKKGESKKFTLLFDDKKYPVQVKLLNTENVTTAPLGKRLCYKLSVSAGTDKLKGTDENLIWLTADSKKVPALMKFNIPVGTGQLLLTQATGV